MQIDSSSYRKLAILAGIVVLCIILWYFSTLVMYIIISLFLSLLGRPLMSLIKKIKISSWSPGNSLAAAVTLFVLMSVIIAVICMFFPMVIGQFTNLSLYGGGELSDLLQKPLQRLEEAINSQLPSADISFRSIIRSQIEPLFSFEVVRNTVGYLTNTVVDIVVGLFCVAFISFFFLQDENLFSRWVMSLIPSEYEGKIQNVMGSIYTLQVRYIVGITIESLLKFVVLFFAFWAFGLSADTAVVASLICALLNVIPYVGPIMGGLIAILLGVVAAPYGIDMWRLVLSMLLAMVIFQLVDNILLQPYIYASSVKAHPLEIFIVILMAGYLAGVVGMLFAIPAYTIIRVLAKEFLGRFKLVRELTTKL